MVRMVCYWGGFYSVPLIFVGSLFFPLAHTDECFLLTKRLFYPKCATVIFLQDIREIGVLWFFLWCALFAANAGMGHRDLISLCYGKNLLKA